MKIHIFKLMCVASLLMPSTMQSMRYWPFNSGIALGFDDFEFDRRDYSRVLFDSEEKMIEAINQPGFDIHQKDFGNYTMLDRAAQKNYLNALQLLVKKGARINPGSNQYTPLHAAAGFVSLEAAQFLLNHGAEVNAQNSNGETALYQAIHDSCDFEEISDVRIAMVELLLRHQADPKIFQEFRLSFFPTVLFTTTFHQNPVIAKMLLDHGADVFVKNRNGQTAVECAFSPCIKELLTKWERLQRIKQKQNSLFGIMTVFLHERMLLEEDGKFASELQGIAKKYPLIDQRMQSVLNSKPA